MNDPHDPLSPQPSPQPTGDGRRYDWSPLEEGMSRTQAYNLFTRVQAAVGTTPECPVRKALHLAVGWHEPATGPNETAVCTSCVVDEKEAVYPCDEIIDVADTLGVPPLSSDPQFAYAVPM